MQCKNDMKNLIILTALCLLLSSGVSAQGWQALEFPLQERLTGICFVHPDTGFVVTDSGKCVRTYDAGRSWEVVQVADGVQLEDVSFANSRIGVVCGRTGSLYRSIDGGSTWEDKSLADTMFWFSDVEMFNDDTGLAVGLTRDSLSPYKSLAYRTTDGGATWKKQEPVGLGYSEILYRPGGPVYLLSFGRLHISHDLGKSWQTVKTVEDLVPRTLSIKGATGILAGPNGMYAYSSDSGKTWTSPSQWSARVYVGAELIDEHVGYIAGSPEIIMRTANGGHTWSRELTAKSFNVLDLCLIGDRLYAVGWDGGIIYKKVK
jgi:photosystem II stability/assembly factor-like uncharacterized protein